MRTRPSTLMAMVVAGALAAAAPAAGQAPALECEDATEFISLKVQPRGGGVDYAYRRKGTGRVRIDLFQQSVGRRIVGERRVARLDGDRRIDLGKLSDGVYMVRFSARAPDGSADVRRIPLRRVNGRFRLAPAYQHRDPCTLVTAAKLERPVFGGKVRNGALFAALRLDREARVRVVVRRGSRVYKRFRARTREPGVAHRLRIAFRGPRGVYRVRIVATDAEGVTQRVTLASRRL